MPVRILVAGGAGFIGGHLSESMCGEHNLTIVSRSPKTPGMAGLGVRTIPCDVADGPAISGVIKEVEPEMIIRLAGGTSHARSFEDPSADLDVNARSTLHMLEGIRRADLECRLVLGSTFIVVGRPESLPVDEGSTCNPATPYAAHRLLAEHYCRIYANVYGMDTGVFRITNSFGPRESVDPKKNAINYLIHRAHKGEEVTIYGGGYFRDLIYVADVVSGIRAVAEKGGRGRTYWISSFERVMMRDFGQMLGSMTGALVRVVDPPEYTKKVDVGDFVVDNSALKSLGWEKRFSLEEGVRETLEYFKSQ